VAALASGRRLFLVISNYRAQTQPGVLYRIYLDLPPGATPQVAERHYVGSINFFNASGRRAHFGRDAGTGNRISFDVTDMARQLRAEGRLGDEPHVVIVPVGRPAAEASPVIGDISLVEQ
jgi:tyrosinase